jgi:hypothetical protein
MVFEMMVFSGHDRFASMKVTMETEVVLHVLCDIIIEKHKSFLLFDINPLNIS